MVCSYHFYFFFGCGKWIGSRMALAKVGTGRGEEDLTGSLTRLSRTDLDRPTFLKV
jgi:hypothetical protein